MNKAIFIDKDGTLIHDVPYNIDISKIVFKDNAFQVLSDLKRLEYKFVIVTNQSGIARGYFKERDLAPVIEFIQKSFRKESINLDGFYYCPHHPDGLVTEYKMDCDCRKPGVGMLKKACKDLNIDPQKSWLIGDSASDINAGRQMGCKTILLSEKPSEQNQEDFQVRGWIDILNVIR